MTRRDWLVAGLSGLAAFIIYVRTLAPTVLPGDSGEFQFAAPLLGLAHPTGYPLYLLLGKLWTLIVPLGDMAYRMNLLSAVLSALTVALLYILCRQLDQGMGASVLAALTLAFSRSFWSQSVRAEVYALNSLLTVALFMLANAHCTDEAPGGSEARLSEVQRQAQPWRSGGWMLSPYLPFFVFGLALTHHRMVVLLIPALLVLAADSNQQATRDAQNAHRPSPIGHRPSRILCIIALLLPLFLYTYIPLQAPVTPYLRLPVGGGPDVIIYENTLNDFVALVMGSVFRGNVGAPVVNMTARLAMAANLLRQQVGLAGIALAVLGLLTLLRCRPGRALGLLLAYAAVAGFCLIYSIGDVADLFTPSYIVIAVWIGAGIDFLAAAAGRLMRTGGSAPVLIVSALLPLSLLPGNWQAVDLSQQTAVRSAWESLLGEPLPSGATLVSNDRDEMTPMWYLQYVENERRDLVGLFPKITEDASFETIGTLLDWLLERKQMPYLIKPMPGLEVKYTVQQAERLFQVRDHAAPPNLQPDRPLNVSISDTIRLIGADVHGVLVAGGVLTVTLYWTPQSAMVENYHSFVQLLTPAGERLAGSDHRPGDVFYPTSMWRQGETLVDRHTVALPPSVPPGTYNLRAGMYRYPSLARLPISGSEETSVHLGSVQIK